MKRKTSIFSILQAMIAFLMPITAAASNIEKPAIDGKTAFAIIVDQTTLEKCRAEIESYKAIVESEGLPSYIVSDNWSCPEQVRDILKTLYKNNNLEGAILIGDIPIAMITKAKHLTSAFKMDEREFPLGRAAVPSDRFYDDFDLKFDFLKDSTDGLKFFYQLSPDSKQYIECDIYTSRLKPLASNGDKYEQIRKYLKKAVMAHKEHNHFDSFVSYTGYGSYSECLKAWRGEQQILHEQYPGVFTKYNNAKFIRFSMDKYPKNYLVRELRRPDLDFMVIHAHGMPNRQYLCTIPNHMEMEQYEYIKYDLREKMRAGDESSREKVLVLAKKWGLDSTWYANYDSPEMIRKDSAEAAQTGILIEDVDTISPNARFVIMDCCFNGDFRHDDFIAGKYIMADGKCVASFANSANVLQDKSSFDLLGLLGQGVRLGNWAKHNNYLESHLFGDPTFHYHAPHGYVHHGEGHHHSHDINEMMSINENGFWHEYINHHNPEYQNVALIKLVRNSYRGIEDILLEKVKESPYAIVRYNALMLLEKLNHPNWHKALIAATNDSFEFTRRIAASRMGFCGNAEFIPYLIDSYVNDYSALRVKFNITSSLVCFDKNLVLEHIEKYFADKEFYLAEKFKKELVDLVSKNSACSDLNTIKEAESDERSKILRIKALRNTPYHQNIDGLIGILQSENTAPLIKQYIVESFSWFRRSFEREKILSVVEKMLAEKQFATPEMERELKRACSKLKSEK